MPSNMTSEASKGTNYIVLNIRTDCEARSNFLDFKLGVKSSLMYILGRKLVRR